MIDELVNSQKMYFLSFRRKPESSPPEADQVVGTNMDSGFHLLTNLRVKGL